MDNIIKSKKAARGKIGRLRLHLMLAGIHPEKNKIETLQDAINFLTNYHSLLSCYASYSEKKQQFVALLTYDTTPKGFALSHTTIFNHAASPGTALRSVLTRYLKSLNKFE